MTDDWELKAIRSQLKLILKQRKFSYGDLAKELKVAEVTIKRFFTSEDISFSKLQKICRAAGISVIDLVALVKDASEVSFSLTTHQEKILSEDEDLYNFFSLLLKHRSIKVAVQKGNLPKEKVPKFLRKLEELDLVEIPLGDRVQVKKTGVLTWLTGGSLQKKFMRLRHNRYLEAFEMHLGKESFFLTSSQRHLRPESLQEMKRDLSFVIQKYRSRAYREETIYAEEQLEPVAWLVGMGKYDPFKK